MLVIRALRRTAEGLKKGDEPAKLPNNSNHRKYFRQSPTQGDRSVKRIVSAVLAVLLLAPGIVTAADKKPGPDQLVSAAARTPQKLDLNRASRDELVAVPGIGPRMAQAIVDLRLKKGAFSRVEELLEVTGIKEKKLASIAGYLEVVPLQTSTATSPATAPR
jgi:competence ComEA-like helix-hairpin-helix protein